MNETRALIQVFDASQAKGERCALATLVDVEGSAYRCPGARMLVGESGKSMGTISAGCLESDLIEHAQRVIHSNLPELIEYDTRSTTEEMIWGLGCDGVMGPRKRTERMLIELGEKDSRFKLKGPDGSRLYAPVGLDIGANSPQEIALSIIAEIRAIVAARKGGHLCCRQAPIHDVYDTVLGGSGTNNTLTYARKS